jgi:hypothetical protein
MAAGKKEMVGNHDPRIKNKKIDKLLFASNATPASLLLLSSSNASLCVWYVVGSQIFIRKTRKLQTLIQAIEIKVDSALGTC